jgi:hypothetical protein
MGSLTSRKQHVKIRFNRLPRCEKIGWQHFYSRIITTIQQGYYQKNLMEWFDTNYADDYYGHSVGAI